MNEPKKESFVSLGQVCTPKIEIAQNVRNAMQTTTAVMVQWHLIAISDFEETKNLARHVLYRTL